MSFRNYVQQLSDYIDENTACKKYKEFMINLSQSKVGRFFDANKDREWFRLKYHPIESQKTLHQQNVNLMRRLKIFNDLNERNYFAKFPYDIRNASQITRLMNAIIIQLEEGPQELVENLLNGGDIPDGMMGKYIPTQPTSIVIDDVSIETTTAELIDFCKSASNHLLRLAQLEPYYIEDGLMRKKVIAVFSNEVDIRDVCWKLSKTKLNNRLLSVSINKPIAKRVLAVDALSNHHTSLINDIRLATILILNFDELKGLYGKRKQLLENIKLEVNNIKKDIDRESCSMQVDDESEDINNVAPPSPPGSDKSGNKDEESDKPFDVNSLDEEKEKEKRKLFEFKFNIDPSAYRLTSKLSKSKNPILEGARLYFAEFIESAQAAYNLSKIPDDLKTEAVREELDRMKQDKFAIIDTIARNSPCSVEESSRFLDKLLWYLRIVHSFDYYNKTIYKQEDDLTLRIGVIHVRGDPDELPQPIDYEKLRAHIQKVDKDYEEFGQSQSQKYVTKDEERYNYKSYGKVITDELTSYAQRVHKPRSEETEEVYKCRHCTRVFQKLGDIGRHFVTKHRWAIDAIELETDFFNAYLFDATKMNPCPPKELLDIPPNRFAKITNLSQMGEDPDMVQQTLEAYSKMESFVREPAPRSIVESDPRNESIVDYNDISFDDAI